MLQDSFAQEEQYRADFALMPFLQGWAALCSGNDQLAAEDYREFKDINKDAQPPHKSDNVLVLVETGTGCFRVSQFLHGRITPEYRDEAAKAMGAYLSLYAVQQNILPLGQAAPAPCYQ